MRWILRSIVMLSAAATPALAQQETTAGWTPGIVVHGLPSRSEGVRGEVSADRKLVKGEPVAVTAWAGRTLCSLGIGGGEPMQRQAPPTSVWRMSADYLGEQSGRHQIRVTAGFTLLAGRESSATTTQTLSLREGDSVVLDAISAPIDAGCEVHTVTFDLRLVMLPADAALVRARYTADLWLVHVDPSGQERREHLVANADGSQPVPFMFNRLGFPIPQLDPRQGNAEAVIRLTGALRLRPRLDGLVDVDVDTNRLLFGLENPDRPPTPPPLTTVRKTLTLKTDETTAIEFPPPASGFSSLALSPGGSGGSRTMGIRAGQPVGDARPTGGTEAVEVKDDRLVLYTNRFFKGHKTQLLITLRRLP